MKKFLAILFTCGLLTSASAIGIGNFKINPEIGASFGTSTGKDNYTLGGYARVWLFGSGFTIAPFYKYNYVFNSNEFTKGYSNQQAGGLIGYKFLGILPYIGGSYSAFSTSAYENTGALNYGILWDLPIVPISIGIDASWQQPKITGTGSRHSQNQVAITLGLIF